MLSPAPGGMVGGASDAELIERVRDGDHDSYAELYERHGAMARRFARSLVRSDADADDAVAEVFAAVLMALEHGKGPVGTFVPYLMRSIRNECSRVNRRSRRESVDRFETVDGDEEPAARRDPYDRLDEIAVVRVAFDSLPVHQQEVLWRTEVDGVSPTELAEQNDSTPHTTAMRAMRARRALGNAYLGQHLAGERAHHDLEPACQAARPHLASYVRGTLGVRRRRSVEAHLEVCPPCDEARHGLGSLNRQLRIVPFLPLHAGAVGTASLGIKAQIVSWFSAQAFPVVASGMLAVSILAPTVDQPITSSNHAGAAGDSPSADVLNPPPVTSVLAVQQLPRPSTVETAGHEDGPRGSTAGSDRTALTTPTPVVTFPAPPTTGVAPAAVAATTTTPEPDSRPAPSAAAAPAARAADPPATAAPSGAPAGRATSNGSAGTPPGRVTDTGDGTGNGSANANAATPPGQVTGTGNGSANANAATPPGQVTGTGNGNGSASASANTPPGQATDNGTGNGNAVTPPGQATDNGGGNATDGTPPGQATNNGNGTGNAGTPPGQATDDGNVDPSTVTPAVG